MIRYLFLTTAGSHFPQHIREETGMPGSYEWYKAVNSYPGCSGEIRHVQDVANTEFLDYDIIHINLADVATEMIASVKDLIKGSNTKLIVNLDYAVEMIDSISAWRHKWDRFFNALKCADFVFAQSEYQRNFLQTIWKHVFNRKERVPFIPHPVDTAGLKRLYVKPEERLDMIACHYHRYDAHLIIPALIARDGEMRTVGRFHDLKVEVPTVLFGFGEPTVDMTLFNYVSCRHEWDKYIYMLSHCTVAVSYYTLHSQDRPLAECACLGIPAVASTCSVFGRKLFPHTTFPPQNIEAMIKAMHKLKESQQFWNYVKDFAWEKVENYGRKPSVERLLNGMRDWGMSI